MQDASNADDIQVFPTYPTHEVDISMSFVTLCQAYSLGTYTILCVG